ISSSIDETAEAAPAGQTDWREAAFSGIGSGAAAEKSHTAGWAPSVEKNSLAITEEEAASLAQARDSFSAGSNSRGAEDWAKAIEAVLPDKAEISERTEFKEFKEEPVVQKFVSTIAPDEAVAEPPPAAPIVSETAQVVEPAEAEGRPNVNSWMAGAVSPWEAELQRASQLTSTWDSVKIVEREVVGAE